MNELFRAEDLLAIKYEVVDLLFKGRSIRQIIKAFRDKQIGTEQTQNASTKRLIELITEVESELNTKSIDKETVKNIAYERYNEIYKRALGDDNYQSAIKALDSLCKMLGVNEPDKTELSVSNYEINVE